jgi:hypothetical protein
VLGPVHGGLGEVTGDGAWTVCFWSVRRFISGVHCSCQLVVFGIERRGGDL